MVVLSTHFAVLACLCAALPLAVPAKAAHLYRGYSMEKDDSSLSPQQRIRDTSFFGWHRHDGKNNGHQIRAHRASELPPPPPLLRRHPVHNPKKHHSHYGKDLREGAHHKVPSASARSRYRRESVVLIRRSSVYVPGEHGDMFVVSRTPPTNQGHGRMGNKRSSHAYVRRQGQVDESNLVLGRIDIMGDTQRLASLTVDSTPIDWTLGQSSAKAFQLNASMVNQTQFIMLPAHDSSSAAGGLNKHVVTLATEVFDPDSAEMLMYCATYDPDPEATSALVMTPCTNQSVVQAGNTDDPCVDDGNDGSTSNQHASQLFSYDPSTGQIEPIATTSDTLETRDVNIVDNLAACAGARVRRDAGSSSSTNGSAKPSSTSTSATALPSGAPQQARNVTLVYVATALQVPASSPSSSSNTTTSTSTSVGIGQAAVFTTTITTTVIATATGSGGSASSGTTTPPRAAASLPTLSLPTTPAISAPTSILPTILRPSVSSSSSASTTATTGAAANANKSFEVEIVGMPAVTPSSSSTTTTTSTRTSSIATSSSLDPQAVASSIAN